MEQQYALQQSKNEPFKIVMLGDGSHTLFFYKTQLSIGRVGKTCLTLRFIQDRFN